MSKDHHHPHLLPNIIKDSSAGGPGIVAGELAAEDDGLISDSLLASHSYVIETVEAVPEADSNDGYALPKAQLLTVVSSLFMAAFLAALDGTVVTTLLTLIASDLNAIGNISWIATAYLLSCSAFQPLFGKLSDIFGRKSLLLLCTAFFAVGCMICVTD
ncbi:MFS transporter, partial [Scheffersomyces stipitis CBS 6054]